MRLRTFLIALVVLALGAGTLAPAIASDERRRKASVDAAVAQLRNSLNETSRQLADATISLQRAEAQLPGARSAVATVRGQLAAAQARDQMLAGKLDVAKAEVQRAKRAISDTQGKIAAAQRLIGRIASASYREGSYGELAVVLQSSTPDDFATRLVLVQNAMRSQGAVLGNLAEDRANLAAQKATLDAKKEQLAQMKREQEALVVHISNLEQRAVAAQQRVEQLIAVRASAVQTIEAQKNAEEQRYQTMQAESRRLQQVLVERARQARLAAARAAARAAAAARASRAHGRKPGHVSHSSGGSSAGGGVLSRPAYGPITSPYGMRLHPVTGVWKLHDGTDFGVSCGTPVHAAAAGTVIQAALVGGYGNQLVIDHGLMRGVGLATSYSHLSRFVVHGGHVRRGQVIGYSGGGEGMYGAGYSTGCHLHFMVYVNGSTTNPMRWL
jgi:murein DD-endopeptidase MepM/ murein hydrolase activator NlpD